MNGTHAIGLAGILAAALAVSPAAAQHHQHHQGAKHQADSTRKMSMETSWKELNGAHSLMHLSHQPLMTSGDLAPARRVADQLASAAERLAASEAPATCSGADLSAQTLKLAELTRAFAKLVADGADDDAVKAGLNGAHDAMEPLMKACRR